MTLKCWSASGALIFDADTVATAGVCLGIWDVPANTAFSQTFPGYTGSTIKVISPLGGTAWNAVVDNDLGYPRVTASPVPGPYIVGVWAMTRQSFTPGTGLFATRADQTSLILSPGGTGLYYRGDATVVSSTANSGSEGGSGAMGYHTLEFSSSTPIFPVLEVVPNFYTEIVSFTRVTSTLYRFTVRRCAASTTDSTGFRVLSAPRLLVYGQKTTPSGPPYFALYKDNGELAWDLMAGTNSLLGALATLDIPTTAGSKTLAVGNNGETWGVIGSPGGLRRQGSQVGATWRMREFRRMYTRDNSGNLIVGEISAFSYLADSNETNPFFFPTNLFVTKHTGI